MLCIGQFWQKNFHIEFFPETTNQWKVFSKYLLKSLSNPREAVCLFLARKRRYV